MAEDILCKRCNRTAPAASGVTWGGPLGEEIRANTCADCWKEWEAAEVMVINELRLNFMDPESQKVLTRHLREFLALDPAQS
jgi:Fe-S cluster biosynthesis and repair protein YggX